MIDLNTYIEQNGNPDAVIDYNGNSGILAGIWGFDEIFTCVNNKTYLNGKYIEGNPLDIFQNTIKKWQNDSQIFSAIGFFSYDFKNIIYPHIPFKPIKNSNPQFWFGKPNKVEILPQLFIIEPKVNSLLINKSEGIEKSEYKLLIEKIKANLENGNVYQINQTYPINFDFEGDPFNLYSQLSWKIKPRRGMYLNTGKENILSFSPEEFIRVKNRHIYSYPMKGTRPEGATELERQQNIIELANSEKDRAEHLMIVDLLRNDLGKICKFGSVKINNLYEIQTYETVHHMVTEVLGELKNSTEISDIIQALFPGGSITGAPKEKAMSIIDNLEDYNRGIYTGAMGYIKPNGDMDFNISIRTLTIEKNNATYPVGGGIVWDSDSNEEWLETKAKSKILNFVQSKMESIC
ncbi:MAG: aminodeoxychorismate synthase component I [Candidatus Marinimicrobia bacterium]|nr:aminodeoxychorismate synthase component I [Candidatus Neomarinimicrobiota bacterium]